MKNNLVRLLLFCSLIFFIKCTGDVEYEDKENSSILGHRGSGANGFSATNEFKENTLVSVVNGFQIFDGVEIDIQASLDNTIWLYHDSKIENHETSNLICIPQSTDQEIFELNQFLTDSSKFTALEEIFIYHTENNLEKYISLDVKGWFDSDCFPERNAPAEYHIKMANEVVRLIEAYGIEEYVIVETDYKTFLDQVKKNNPDVPCYLLAYDNLKQKADKAIEKSYQGISFNFRDSSLTDKNVDYLRENDLKLQLWTPNSKEAIDRALSFDPDFIQTDNTSAVQQLEDKE